MCKNIILLTSRLQTNPSIAYLTHRTLIKKYNVFQQQTDQISPLTVAFTTKFISNIKYNIIGLQEKVIMECLVDLKSEHNTIVIANEIWFQSTNNKLLKSI